MTPMLERAPTMGKPAILMLPDVTLSSPPHIIRSVLLPHPLGPMIATKSPASTVSETSRIASRGGRLTRKTLWRPEAMTMLPSPSRAGASTVLS